MCPLQFCPARLALRHDVERFRHGVCWSHFSGGGKFHGVAVLQEGDGLFRQPRANLLPGYQRPGEFRRGQLTGGHLKRARKIALETLRDFAEHVGLAGLPAELLQFRTDLGGNRDRHRRNGPGEQPDHKGEERDDFNGIQSEAEPVLLPKRRRQFRPDGTQLWQIARVLRPT